MNDRVTHVVSAAPETCHWIWSTEFAPWLSSPDDKGIFWICGKPGSGKSTLMKYLAGNCETRRRLPFPSSQQTWEVVRFFYDFRANQTLANTKEGMLRSILHQLLRDLQLLQNIDLDSLHLKSDLDKAVVSVARLLQTKHRRVLLLIDGLDECGSNIREMMTCIRKICDQTSMRVCLASRPNPFIQHSLRDCLQIKMQDHNTAGIRAYIETALAEIESVTGAEEFSTPVTVESLVQRAEGVFLWIRFAVDVILQRLLQGCTEAEVWGEVGSLPDELSDMYQRIFDRVPEVCRAEVATVMLLLDHAQHVVSLDELFVAWLTFNSNLSNSKLIPNIACSEAFCIRLKGFVGELIDIGLSGSCHSRVLEDFKLCKNADLTLDSAIFKSLKGIQVRISHKTLRAFLRRTNLMRRWAGEELGEMLNDTTWLALWCGTIINVDRKLGADRVWCAIDEIASEMDYHFRPPNLIHYPCDYGQVSFISQMTKVLEHADFGLATPDNKMLAKFLTVSIRGVHEYIRSFDPDTPIFAQVEDALRSPLMLLHNLSPVCYPDPGNLTKRFPLRRIFKMGRPWRFDLAIAAAYAWYPYLNAHASDLATLSDLEADFLVRCALVPSTILGPLNRRGSGPKVEASAPQMLHLLFSYWTIQAKHIALYLSALNDRINTLDWLCQVLTDTDRRHLLDSPCIEVTGSGLDSFLLYRFHSQHLLNVWIICAGDHMRLTKTLSFLMEIGFDIHSWRGASGETIAETALNSNFDVFHILSHLGPLMHFGLDFRHKTSGGESLFERIRDFCSAERLRIEGIYREHPCLGEDSLKEMDAFEIELDAYEAKLLHNGTADFSSVPVNTTNLYRQGLQLSQLQIRNASHLTSIMLDRDTYCRQKDAIESDTATVD